jgi:hypothetical protein
MKNEKLFNEKHSKGLIPTFITKEHHQVLSYWINSGLKDADLFHIDGHSDMGDGCSLVSDLHIANFICPAVHHGIVSSVYWLNPHSEKRLIDCGTTRDEPGRIRLETKEIRGKIYWDCKDNEFFSVGGRGKFITPSEMRLRERKPLILDIDLDAFCCHRVIEGSYPANYDGCIGFETRINETVEILRRLKTPDLITITESQGQYSYVPYTLLQEVKRQTIQNICGIYIYRDKNKN